MITGQVYFKTGMKFLNKHIRVAIILSLAGLVGCSKSSQASDTNEASNNKSGETSSNAPLKEPKVAALAPEDNPALKGTAVLGFKLGDSTFDSVKARLSNYNVLDGESYAGGPILENDGSGFDIEGLQSTSFAFDANNKLVCVSMTFSESNKMGHDTYRQLVAYVKARKYKVIRVVAPFVGNQLTEFSTPNHDVISVNSPHLDFHIYVEYATQGFNRARARYQQQQSSQQKNREATNF